MFLTVCLNPTIQRTLLLDEFCEGDVNRTSEHSPDASGKGVNVARVLHQLGEEVVHLTQVGGSTKELFCSLAAKDGVVVRSVESGSEIRFCITLLIREKRTTTELVEGSDLVSPGTEDAVYGLFEEQLSLCKCVIFSGSKAQGFSNRVFPAMVEAAKKGGKVVVLDFRGDDLKNSLEFRPDIIKPNLSEFVETFFPEHEYREENPLEGDLDLKVRDKMLSINDKYGIYVVLTNGVRDTFYTLNGIVETRTPPKIEILNTTGCGDAFAAGIASGYMSAGCLTDALAVAEECALKNASLVRPGVIR